MASKDGFGVGEIVASIAAGAAVLIGTAAAAKVGGELEEKRLQREKEEREAKRAGLMSASKEQLVDALMDPHRARYRIRRNLGADSMFERFEVVNEKDEVVDTASSTREAQRIIDRL
jgi:acetyl-CoA carboxylase carboxyltransferase component